MCGCSDSSGGGGGVMGRHNQVNASGAVTGLQGFLGHLFWILRGTDALSASLARKKGIVLYFSVFLLLTPGVWECWEVSIPLPRFHVEELHSLGAVHGK